MAGQSPPSNLIPIGSFLAYRGAEQLGQYIGFIFGPSIRVTPQGQYVSLEAIGGGVGPQGPPGPTGATGAQGPQGIPGTNGAAGAQGPQGIPGEDGAAGAQGPQGDPGTDGAVGAQGPQGDIGPDGAQGIQGNPGADGAAGATGPQGDVGATGPDGPQGIPGNDGATGAPGADGAAGPQGIPGNDGATGAQGIQGVQGIQGIPGPNGSDVSSTDMGMWLPPGNATTVPLAIGIAAPTTTGTATARTVATTNRVTQTRRLGYVSAATAGALCGARNAANQFWRGNAAGLGGFRLVMRIAPSDAAVVAGARMFCGLSTVTAAPTNIEPNTLTNCVGVCQLSTSSNLHVIHNDAAGTATTIDLGADFPVSGNASLYEVTLTAAANGAGINYAVKRIGTAFVATGTLAADLPVSTTLMGLQLWRTNNATLLAVALDLVGVYIDTPAFA